MEFWPGYRLVLERYITLPELDNLSIDDVLDMNAVADAWDAAKAKARK